MTSLTTQRITVSAKSSYQDRFSRPTDGKYVYAYQIRIHNRGDYAVQLLSRAWEVIDATGERRFIEGEGVVGEQPVIHPGESFEYSSWVQFDTPVGAMQGSYVMVRTDDKGQELFFQVTVPKFLHLAPELLN